MTLEDYEDLLEAGASEAFHEGWRRGVWYEGQLVEREGELGWAVDVGWLAPWPAEDEIECEAEEGSWGN